MIADMLCYKNLNLRVTELYIGGRKVNISLVFITQSYFAAPKNIRLNSAHYFIMKIPNKWELQQIAFLPIHQVLTLKTLWVFIKMYCKTIFFLMTDTTLALDKFQEDLWKLMTRLNMKNYNMISAKIDKCQCYREEKILPTDKSRIIHSLNSHFLLSVKLLKDNWKRLKTKKKNK